MEKEVVIIIVLLVLLAIQSFRFYSKKTDCEDLSDIIAVKDADIVDKTKESALLRERLTESTDKVASLKVSIDRNNQTIEEQKATIKHHEETIEECAKTVEKKPEPSTQYPVAPPDLTKKSNRKFTKGPGGKFVKNT